MNEETRKRYTQIIERIQQLDRKKQQLTELGLRIREISLELKSERNTFYTLLGEAELPFPEEAQRGLDDLEELLRRLEIDRDRLAADLPEVSGGTSAPLMSEGGELPISKIETEKEPEEELSSKPYLSMEELSRYTGIPKGTLYKMTHRREIPFSKPGGTLIFNRKKIDGWLEKHERKALF
jgi:excisionase family DNA binding protein